MLSRAVAVSNSLAKTHGHRSETNNTNEKDKEILQSDKDLYSSFWEGVHTATIIQNDKFKMNPKKPKFRKSMNDSLVEQIFVEHSKEVCLPSLPSLPSLSVPLDSLSPSHPLTHLSSLFTAHWTEVFI